MGLLYLYFYLCKVVVTYSHHVSCGFVDPSGRVGPRPLACWIVFESRPWMFFLLCVVRSLWDGLIPRPDES